MAFDMTGLVVTASSINAATYWEAIFAFDGVNTEGPGHAWASASGLPQWLQARVTNAQVCAGYIITPRPEEPTQAPNTWTFLGLMMVLLGQHSTPGIGEVFY